MRLYRLFFSSAALMAVAAAAPAEARSCPSGQILRVSKNACMDKSEATKLGIYRGGRSAGKAKATKTAARPPSASAPENDESKPSSRAEKPARARSTPEPDAKKDAKIAPASPPKTVDKTSDTPKIDDKAKAAEQAKPAEPRSVRIIPMSVAPAAYAAPVAPAATPTPLAPIEPPKTLTPSPFGSLGGKK